MENFFHLTRETSCGHFLQLFDIDYSGKLRPLLVDADPAKYPADPSTQPFIHHHHHCLPAHIHPAEHGHFT